jgi:hypothetical protein
LGSKLGRARTKKVGCGLIRYIFFLKFANYLSRKDQRKIIEEFGKI